VRRLLCLLLVAACADTTEPEFRSVRAPESGKPVWNTYEIVVDWTNSPESSPPAVDYVDTLQFDATGLVVVGGSFQPPDRKPENRQWFSPFPFVKGAQVSGALATWRGGYWVFPYPQRTGFDGVCSQAEEQAWYDEFGWGNWDCESADLIVQQTFTGTVQPNGVVAGTVQGAFGLHDIRFASGTFTLTPIRGRTVDFENVTYALVPERQEFVLGSTYNVAMLVIARGTDGTTAWADEQFLAFEAPEGCVRDGARIQCTEAATFPLVIPVTILPGAEWYIAGTDIPVAADFTGQQVTVTFIN
jgi:hypothetical protein